MSELFTGSAPIDTPSDEPSLHDRVRGAHETGDQATLDAVDAELEASRQELFNKGAKRVIYFDSQTILENTESKPLSWGQSSSESFWSKFDSDHVPGSDIESGLADVLTASGREVPDLSSQPPKSSEVLTPTTEQEKLRAEAVSDVESLVESTWMNTPFKPIDLVSEHGAVHVETTDLEPGITIEETVAEVEPDHTVIEDIILTIEGADGQPDIHQIEVERKNDAEPMITLDGEQPTSDELASIKQVVEHIAEMTMPATPEQPEANQDPAEKQGAEQPTAPNIPRDNVAEKRNKRPVAPKGMAESFVNRMIASQGARDTIMQSLTSSGVDPHVFMKNIGASEITSTQLGNMQGLFQKYPPNSAIWSEPENPNSQLGRAARDAKMRLRDIINGLK